VNAIPFSGIRRFFEPLNSETISLGVGEPDFPTPEDVRRQTIEALSIGHIKYTSNAGSYELRELIIKYLSTRFDINNNYSPDDVLITVGASEAIDLAMRAIIDPGDEVIVRTDLYCLYTWHKICIRNTGIYQNKRKKWVQDYCRCP
jgi:aminotransferase